MNLLDRYLAQSYRREVLGKPAEVMGPGRSPELIADIKARLAQIDSLRLGASLASRDYVQYQNRRALAQLQAQLEADDAKLSGESRG